MYSLDEINQALEKGKLSDVLYKLERFAQEHGLTELAKWCSWELDGYPNGYEELNQSEETRIMKYRTVPVEWRDIYGRPMIIDPKLAFIQKVPIWIGVSEIEGYEAEGFGYSIPSFTEQLNRLSTVPVGSGHVAPEAVRGLLGRIRLQARARLHDNIPRVPERSVQTTESKNVSRRAHELYEEAQTLASNKSLDLETAKLLIEKADDAIREFGNTKQEKKVQLREWKGSAEQILPPNTIKDLRKRAESQLLKKSYPKNALFRNLLLAVVALTVIALGLLYAKKVLSDLRLLPGSADANITTQRGFVAIPETKTYEVFYPQSFASVPNLTFSKMVDKVYVPVEYEVLEQRQDGFKIKIKAVGGDPGARAIEWIAVGRTK